MNRIKCFYFFACLTATCFLYAAPASAQLRITEFMALNASVLQDEDGEFSDWLEIYNGSNTTVNLDGWHLTDDAAQLSKWTLPAVDLPAGHFLLVFASGKDRYAPNLHANFALSGDGEYLALVRPDGTTIEHAYAPAFPPQYRDITYGVQTHGTNPTLRAGAPGYLIVRTPGTNNTVIPATHPLYSDHSVARIDLTISQPDWDWLMQENPDKESFRSVTARFRHGQIDLTVTNVGIQCRGNTSLVQHPRSFNLAFNAFVPGQTMLDIERLNLNAEVNDPSSVRSKLVHDLHEAADLAAPYANQIALVVHGPEFHRGNWTGGVFFDAVRKNVQPIDDVFVEQRFGSARGNLYKCLYMDGRPADLTYQGGEGWNYGPSSTYALRYNGSGDASFSDLAAFIGIINNTADPDFPNAIMEHFEVDDFLKRMAIDVLTGHWDNYRYNANNYHLFLNPETRRWDMIPYDYDNTFDIRWLVQDWTVQDVFDWRDGSEVSAPLVNRILAVPEFRNRYAFYMKEMLDTSFTSATLEPLALHTRGILTNALPAGGLPIANMKEAERDRYQWDWPFWSYDQFLWSLYEGQEPFNDNVPDATGVFPFIDARASSAYDQLGTLANIGPILSDFTLAPSLPRSDDPLTFTIAARDDVSVSDISLFYAFDNGPTNEVAMPLIGDQLYQVGLPAFGATGTLRYVVRALDGEGHAIFHPFGGPDYAATVAIGSPALALVITELNYNPYNLTAAEIAAGWIDEQDMEFIELHNAGNTPLDLNGYKLQDGIAAIMPPFVLEPGEYAVLVRDMAAFAFRYTNTAIRIIGTYSGKLSNGGETIRLEDAQGGVIANLTYADGGAWPGRADGDGSTLERIDLISDDNVGGNWRSSSEYGGTPGAPGLGPDNRIVVNEVLTHTDPPLSDTIELFNTTESAIDISGWFLSDGKSNYRKYAIPPGTVLSAGGYISFNETNHFNTSAGVDPNDFALDGAYGEDVYLLETDAAGRLIRFVDRAEFGPAANGESFGRWPNGSGRIVPMISRTFGSANSGPRIGPVVISEIMYHPASSNGIEFIEIANGSGQPVDMTHWQIGAGISYTFPTGHVIAASGVAVVVPFDPDDPANAMLLATFRSDYGIDETVPLLGPYAGALSNGGERIRLFRPDDPPAEAPTYYPLMLEDEVAYDDVDPWPLVADGFGASLTRFLPAAWGDAASSWYAADPPTPGSHGEPPETFDLTVLSAHGTANPPVGTRSYVVGVTLTNTVTLTEVNGGTRYVNVGWSLTGHDPASGTTNWMHMTVTNHATLSWLWTTNYLLAVTPEPGGTVAPASGWQVPGADVQLTAAASNDYAFVHWTGDTHAIHTGAVTDHVVTVRLDAPVYLTAHFASTEPQPPTSIYDAMHVSGHFNGWATAPMTLESDYTWQLDVTIAEEDQAYKFRVNTDNWDINWGDDQPRDGVGDWNGSNIPFTEGTGTYRIVFNDLTFAYSAALLPAVTPYDTWKAANFSGGELDDPAVSGPLADPDTTGVANLYRYATGLDRYDDPALSRLRGSVSGTSAQFRYRRLLEPASNLFYIIERNETLHSTGDWQEAIMGSELIEQGTTPTGDSLTEEVEVEVPASTFQNQLYLRLKIEQH
jgi:spore coat protein CotH